MNRSVSKKTCRCPGCGGRTEYDPEWVARYVRSEDRGGERRWRGYDYVVCASCGLPVLVPDPESA